MLREVFDNYFANGIKENMADQYHTIGVVMGEFIIGISYPSCKSGVG